MTAIPELIEMLEIAGNVITIDAMGFQKDITSLIIKKKGDYILALKRNLKLLHEAVKSWFELAKRTNYLGKKYDDYEKVEAGHHQGEKRQVWTIGDKLRLNCICQSVILLKKTAFLGGENSRFERE